MEKAHTETGTQTLREREMGDSVEHVKTLQEKLSVTAQALWEATEGLELQQNKYQDTKKERGRLLLMEGDLEQERNDLEALLWQMQVRRHPYLWGM